MDALRLVERFYVNEWADAVLYEELAREERDERTKRELERLAELEKRHAEFWRSVLERRGRKAPKPKVSRVTLFSVKLLRRVLGAGAVASLLEMGENSAIESYFQFLREFSGELDEEEVRILRRVILDEIEHERFFREEEERFHVEHIRDLILGMNDGLVELLGAVTGLSAVYPTRPTLVGVSGLVVGVAGALSMAIGAFISVRSQRQVKESVRSRMEVLFEVSPEKALEELTDRLREGGLPEEIAKEIAEKLGEKPEVVKRLLLPETEENEVRAALYTGLSYLVGVAFPVSPYFIASSSMTALALSVVLAGTVLGAVASIIALLSGISVKKKVLEMVATGLGAAFLSYLFGRLMEAVFHVSAL
ncbi:VIT1/CCC1 transporter family protein [Thermococcus sp.]